MQVARSEMHARASMLGLRAVSERVETSVTQLCLSVGSDFGLARAARAGVGAESRGPSGLGVGSAEANRKRIRTAKPGNRDKRDQLPALGPELAVSGSYSAVPLSQDPAKAREFLGRPRVAGAKSLQPQTGWRKEWGSNPRQGIQAAFPLDARVWGTGAHDREIGSVGATLTRAAQGDGSPH